MNLLTRFFRLFDLEYQKSFRLAVRNLKTIVDNNNNERRTEFNDFLQNNTAAIMYIYLLRNEFTGTLDVYEFIIKKLENIITKYNLNTRLFDQKDNQIYWQEIFNALEQITLQRDREKVRAELRLLSTISADFGFSKPWIK